MQQFISTVSLSMSIVLQRGIDSLSSFNCYLNNGLEPSMMVSFFFLLLLLLSEIPVMFAPSGRCHNVATFAVFIRIIPYKCSNLL